MNNDIHDGEGRTRYMNYISEIIKYTPKIHASLAISPVFRGKENMMNIPQPHYAFVVGWEIIHDLEH